MGSPYHYLDTEAWGFEGNAAVLSPADKEIYQVECCFLWWLWYVLSPVHCAPNWHILGVKAFADKRGYTQQSALKHTTAFRVQSLMPHIKIPLKS